MNIVTKSGTNKFHGSGLGFRAQRDIRRPQSVHRFLHLGQLSHLAKPTGRQVSAGTQTAAGAAAILSGTPVSPLGYTENMYGGTFGGPIKQRQNVFLRGL